MVTLDANNKLKVELGLKKERFLPGEEIKLSFEISGLSDENDNMTAWLAMMPSDIEHNKEELADEHYLDSCDLEDMGESPRTFTAPDEDAVSYTHLPVNLLSIARNRFLPRTASRGMPVPPNIFSICLLYTSNGNDFPDTIKCVRGVACIPPVCSTGNRRGTFLYRGFPHSRTAPVPGPAEK